MFPGGSSLPRPQHPCSGSISTALCCCPLACLFSSFTVLNTQMLLNHFSDSTKCWGCESQRSCLSVSSMCLSSSSTCPQRVSTNVQSSTPWDWISLDDQPNGIEHAGKSSWKSPRTYHFIDCTNSHYSWLHLWTSITMIVLDEWTLLMLTFLLRTFFVWTWFARYWHGLVSWTLSHSLFISLSLFLLIFDISEGLNTLL